MKRRLKYDDTEYLDLEIDQVVLEDTEIIVTAKAGESVLKEGRTDEIEGYHANVYMVEDVEPASGGVLQSEPYTLVGTFRKWPATYEWTACIHEKENGVYAMCSAWRRIKRDKKNSLNTIEIGK